MYVAFVLLFWLLSSVLLGFVSYRLFDGSACLVCVLLYLLLGFVIGHGIVNQAALSSGPDPRYILSVEELPIQQVQCAGKTFDVVVLPIGGGASRFDVRLVSRYFSYNVPSDTKLWCVQERARGWGVYMITGGFYVVDALPYEER